MTRAQPSRSPTDPVDRLADAIQGLFDQVPPMQRRYRAALSRVHPDDAVGLVDAWTEFHQSLTEARYDPGTGGLLRGTPWSDGTRHSEERYERAMEIAAELSDARSRLRMALLNAETSAPAAGLPDRSIVLARWRLLRRGEHWLRRAIAHALSALPAADHRLLRSLAPLAAGYTAYLEADRALAWQWAAAAQDGNPATVATLDQWLSYTIDVRNLLDQFLAGYGEPGPLPVAPWRVGDTAPPRHAAAVPAPATVEQPPAGPAVQVAFRAELDTVHDEYPQVIADCRRLLVALGGLGDRSAAGSLRAALLTAWGRYDDALAGLSQRVGGGRLARASGAVTDQGWLAAEFDHAAELRAALADRLADVAAWLVEFDRSDRSDRWSHPVDRSVALVTVSEHNGSPATYQGQTLTRR